MAHKSKSPDQNSIPCVLLAIDVGTQSTRAQLIDGNGAKLFGASIKIALDFGAENHVEQSGPEILCATTKVIRFALAKSRELDLEINCAGLATQRSSVIAWDRSSGEVLSPVISWMDTRAATKTQALEPYQNRIRQITGLRLSAHYGASKMAWLLEHNKRVQAAVKSNTLALAPLCSYLLFHLLENKPYLVDHANAIRTQLLNRETCNWDPWLLETFGLESLTLPQSVPVRHDYGKLAGTSIALTAANGDQTAALYQQGQPDPEAVQINLGTGGFILYPGSPARIDDPYLLNHICDSTESNRMYVTEATVNGVGSALNWLDRQANINIGKPSHDANNQTLFINAVGGLASPWWQANIEPEFIDPMSGNAVTADNADKETVIESILFLLQANLDRMIAAGCNIKKINISGGIANSENLCQKLANLSGIPVFRSPETEATALGIAWLSGSIDQNWGRDSAEQFKPKPDNMQQRRYLRLLGFLFAKTGLMQPGCLVAHRGDTESLPENSAASIRATIACGASHLEIDVQISADGIAFLYHDNELKRLSGVEGKITELESAQARNLVVAEPGRLADRFIENPILTLREAVDLINRNPQIICFVELKPESVKALGIESAVNTVAKSMAKAKFRWVLISFELDALKYAKKRHKMPIGWILEQYSKSVVEIAADFNPEYLFCNSKKLRDEIRDFNADPWSWVVYECNSLDQVEHWIRNGVSLVETAGISRLIKSILKAE